MGLGDLLQSLAVNFHKWDWLVFSHPWLAIFISRIGGFSLILGWLFSYVGLADFLCVSLEASIIGEYFSTMIWLDIITENVYLHML